MGYNLTIDQGNSSAKIAVWDKEDLIFDATYQVLTIDIIKYLLTEFPSIDNAIFCSVANNGKAIVDMLRSSGIATYYLDSNTPLPITNAYKTPHTLGRDRIAAAVGAWSKHKGNDVLVIDMGTAITYDVVTSHGCYIGGNIAPGINMRLDALHNYTSRLPIVNPIGDCPLWGVDTDTAMRSGVITGVIGEITYYKNKLHSNHKIVITGGSAVMIEGKLDFPAEVDQHLVNRGLNSILRYNENN